MVYNQEIFEELGVEQAVGKSVSEWNWDDLIAACEILQQGGVIPLAIGGDYASFWSWQFGWLYRVYTDQYFRDMEELVVAQPGDYLYDEELQTSWFFDKEDKFNDTEDGYIVNKIRLAKLVEDGEIGPAHPKFQDMIKNLSRLVPAFVPPNFTSLKPDDAVKYFLRGEAAIYIDLMSFYAGIERTFEDTGVEKFEVGVFQYPPMVSHTQGVDVGVDYTRDTGGASGNYGVIYKNKKQSDLAMDFLMFLISPRGQTLYLETMARENIAPQGISLVKDVTMPEQWVGKYDIEFSGSADSNPLAAFSRGFMDEPEGVREYVELRYIGVTKILNDLQSAPVKQHSLLASQYAVPYGRNAKSRAGSREVMKMNNFWKAASRKRKMFFLFSALILAAVIALLSVLFSSLLIRPEKIRLKSDVSAVFADERYEYYGETDGKIERADESGVKTFADLGSKILLLEKLGENLAVATEDRKITLLMKTAGSRRRRRSTIIPSHSAYLRAICSSRAVRKSTATRCTVSTKI
ncbi:MAG: ABC transporter substrate-binding protein [Candidatus Borkfalkia sp.]